jgi:hypothetical protein
LVLLYLLQQCGFNLLLFYKNDLIQEKKNTHISPLQTPSGCTELGKQTHRMRLRTLDMQNLEHEATK